MLTLRMNKMLPEPVMFAGEIDRMFESFLRSPFAAASGARGPAAFPALNVWESRDALHVEAEVPGFQMDQIDVSLTGDELTITGSREAEKIENGTVHRRERGYGRFTRTLRLGTPVDSQGVSATLENGVLSVTLPKAEGAKARKIAVKSK